MARYWCGWCGETTIAPTGHDVACRRCVIEFSALFGYTPRTSMDELGSGEEPGVPAAARKRFTFYDAETNEVIGVTEAARPSGRRRKREVHLPDTAESPGGNTHGVASRERKEERWSC